MTDILDKMKLDQEANQRSAESMERIADAFEQMAKLLAQFYEKMYPPKHEPAELTLTRVKSPLDQIKEAQGSAPEETTAEWLDIGPRERQLIENPPRRKPSRAPRIVPKRGGAR